jgi:hypothetical protein
MNENIPEEPISSTAQQVKELRKQQRSHTWLQLILPLLVFLNHR